MTTTAELINNTGLYQLGQVDPLPNITPSGTDVRVYLDGKCLGGCQAISWSIDYENFAAGTIIYLLLCDKGEPMRLRPKDRYDSLKVVWANEKTEVELLSVGPVVILSEAAGVSVDDLVIEYQVRWGSVNAN